MQANSETSQSFKIEMLAAHPCIVFLVNPNNHTAVSSKSNVRELRISTLIVIYFQRRVQDLHNARRLTSAALDSLFGRNSTAVENKQGLEMNLQILFYERPVNTVVNWCQNRALSVSLSRVLVPNSL